MLGHLDAQGNIVHYEGGAEKAGAGITNDLKAALDENGYLGNGGGFAGQSETFIDDASFVKLWEISEQRYNNNAPKNTTIFKRI